MSQNADNVGSVVARQILNPASAANTAAATSGSGLWADTQDLEGTLDVIQAVGAVTGSITGKLQVADDANGTGAADVTGATFTAVSSANNVQSISVSKNALAKRYIGYVGTIVTGPAVVGVTVLGAKKYV